jgi:hypothetical protein
MFTPNQNPGFNSNLGAGMPHYGSLAEHTAQLEGFDPGETIESLIVLEERIIAESLIDICVQRAQESNSGYSASYFVRDFQRQGLFGSPMRSYEEIDYHDRNQDISPKITY